MPFAIRLTPPKGAPEYIPPGFGFTAHAHVTDEAAAERIETRALAERRLWNYIDPPAFWNSERRHNALMREKFRGWKCEVIELAE